MDDPLPVGVVVQLLGAARGARRLQMCEFLGLALAYHSRRLVDDPPLRAKWEEASATGAEGPWMLRMMLEGFRR